MLQRSEANAPNRRATALVEFAVLLPILFLVLFGIIEYGQFLYAQQSVTLAAREACRIAILPGTTKAQATARAANVLSQAGISNFSISFDPDPPSSASNGAPVRVDVEAEFSQISWLGIPIFLNGTTLRGTAVMRREWSEQL